MYGKACTLWYAQHVVYSIVCIDKYYFMNASLYYAYYIHAYLLQCTVQIIRSYKLFTRHTVYETYCMIHTSTLYTSYYVAVYYTYLVLHTLQCYTIMYSLYIYHAIVNHAEVHYIPQLTRHSIQYRLYYAYFAMMPCWTNCAVHTVSHIIACQACTIYRDTHHVLYRMSFAYPAARYIIYILYFHILYCMCLIHPDTVYILLNYNGLRILYETY